MMVGQPQSYPWTDSYGTVWADSSGILTEEFGTCFICKRETSRLDIDFHGYYCGSEACDEEIKRQLDEADKKHPIKDWDENGDFEF